MERIHSKAKELYWKYNTKIYKFAMLTKYKQLYRGWSGAGRFTGVITAVMRLGTANNSRIFITNNLLSSCLLSCQGYHVKWSRQISIHYRTKLVFYFNPLQFDIRHMKDMSFHSKAWLNLNIHDNAN